VTLTLTLRTQPPARVAAAALIPERLRGLAVSDVAGLSLRCGRERLAVGELFEVSGAGDEELVLAGDLRRLDGIGASMSSGRVLVEGVCGDYLGARMSGGEIVVRGDAGDWTGADMAGGLLRISGDAGARLGAAYPGARAGMTGGEIIVTGDAGEEAGAGMRRGLVAVGGRTASGAGLRMLAGTVIALSGIGAEAGLGNKRGSLVSGRSLEALPSYAYATRYRPPALGMQLRRARELGLTVDDALLRGTWARWSGDRTELGRGEILIFDDEEHAP
jgi:formylmethanofuran dehydrogenase subunit C